MQPLWPLLTSFLLLAPAVDHNGNGPSEGLAASRSFDQMDPAARQEWLRGLLTRLDRANRVVFGPDEVVRRRAGYVAVLRRMAQGEAVSQQERLDLLRQADEREKAAIERLARQFRVLVYHTFRQQRGTFTRHRAAWNRVEASWKAAGGRFEDQDRLIDWLEVAIHNSMPDSIGPLPPDPRFEPGTSTPEALVDQEPMENIKEPVPLPPRTPQRTVSPPLPGISLPERNRDVAEPSKPRQPSAELVDSPRFAAMPSATVARRTVTDGRPTARDVATGRPPPTTRPPIDLPAVAAQALPAVVPSTEPTAREAAASAAIVDPVRPAAAHPEIPQQPSFLEPPADRTMPPVPPMSKPVHRLARTGSIAPGTSTKHPSVDANGMTGLPFPTMADPFAEPVPAKPHVAGELETSLAGPGDATPVSSSVRVNLDELAARIAGANLALRTLEGELEKEQRWNARRLGPLVDQLSGLVTRKHDLEMFRELISQQERASVGWIESPRRAISQLAARVFEARTRASGPGFLGAQADRQAELRHLDALSEQLAKLASDE